MNETQLQIVITAVNEAAEQLASVSSALTDMAEQAATSASDINKSFSETGADIATDMSSAASDAGVAMSGLAADTATAAGDMESSVSSVGGKIQALGIQLGILGAAIVAPAVEAIKAAGDQQDAFDQLGNTVQNVYGSVSDATSGNATEVADLTAKINAEKSTIAEADAALTKWTGTTAEVSAAHEKAGTTIATAQINIQKYEQQLANLTNAQSLVGGSSAQTTTQFEAAARAATSLGFYTADSATALTYLFSATQDVNETMSAYQDALDLAAKLNIPVAQAANDVVQAMNGQGRSLRDLGINVADGLSGQTALAAIQEKVAGAAQLAATQGLGPLNVAQAQLNMTLADFGMTILPMLTSFLETLSKIIAAVGDWAQAHPKLAEALLIFLGLLGGVLLIIAPLLTMFGLLIIGIEAFTTALIGLNITMLAAMGMVLLYVGVFILIAAAVALVIVYHKQIMDAVEAAWNWIINEVSNAMLAVGSTIENGFTAVKAFVSTVWEDIKTIVVDYLNFIVGVIVIALQALDPQWQQQWNALSQFLKTVWSGMQAIVQTAISVFQTDIMTPILALWTWWQSTWTQFSTFIATIWDGIVSYVSGAVSKLISMIDTVLKPIQTVASLVGGGVAGLASGVASAASAITAVGASVTHVQDAVITPSGQIVQTDVADYLIATKNPGALVGAGPGPGAGTIVININGGSYLNQGGAQQIAQALATMIGQQLKLKVR